MASMSTNVLTRQLMMLVSHAARLIRMLSALMPISAAPSARWPPPPAMSAVARLTTWTSELLMALWFSASPTKRCVTYAQPNRMPKM